MSFAPYLEMGYASIDADGVGEADSVLIVSALPPLGWERFTALDGTFPRGAASYGGTGGSSTHTHDVTITTGGPSTTGGSKAIGQTTADASHTHSCTTTTDTGSNIPPYMEVIFAQRNDPAVSTSLGSEEPQETEPGEEEVTYNYVYDGDGGMVMESIGTVTTIYIGGIYEYEISGAEVITRSYYYAGSQRVAMREGGALFYLLGDHLGSTSLTLDASGNKVAEQRYKPYGSTRYEWGTAKTDYGYTGQRSRALEFGLIYYNARWYDSYLKRWVQPDTIIPEGIQGIQAWDRYAYVNNNPILYNDPSGNCIFCISLGIALIVAALSLNQLDVGIEKVTVATSYSNEIARETEAANQWQENCVGQCHYAHQATITPGLNVGGARPETPYSDMMAEGYYDIAQGITGLVGATTGAAQLTLNTFSVKTPYGRAWQKFTPEAIKLRGQVSNGMEIYRGGNFEKSNVIDAQFWAPESPLSPTYSNRYGSGSYSGLPDFVIGGQVYQGENFVTRTAPGAFSNAGGALEVVTRPNTVRIHFFHVR